MSSTITLTARELARLTDPVVPHASKDDTLPMLCSVLVRVRGEYVTASATDRYRIAYQRIKPDAYTVQPDNARPLANRIAGEPTPDAEPTPTLPEGFAVLIPVRVLAQVRRMFKPSRNLDPVLTIGVEKAEPGAKFYGDTLTVQAAGGLDGLTGATLRFNVDPAEKYPKTDRLFTAAITAADTSREAAPMVVNPSLLADFAKGQPRYEPITITQPEHPNKPWLIRIGDDFLGALVPVNRGQAESPAAWLDMLDVESVSEVAA